MLCLIVIELRQNIIHCLLVEELYQGGGPLGASRPGIAWERYLGPPLEPGTDTLI